LLLPAETIIAIKINRIRNIKKKPVMVANTILKKARIVEYLFGQSTEIAAL
jgi:hypothetical protein